MDEPFISAGKKKSTAFFYRFEIDVFFFFCLGAVFTVKITVIRNNNSKTGKFHLFFIEKAAIVLILL